ncbi:2961_t:CDS:2 [Acaulospora colombiana]|uniref:2961_t:CDS:1 n=1 Tax=Acaulospora colombiana TaxID=27376 RepID=A0ACA9K2U3_9GLOM|nr:2961_t:CDS:2 [Acaulospora colombiana]
MSSNNGGQERTSVQVALRIRPIDSKEKQSRFQRQVITTSPCTPNQVIAQGEKKQTFNFDYVFGPEAEQKEVYQSAVEKLVDQFLEGYNVTILAYGQTSSGKTHTMGTSHNSSISPEQKGIIPRAMSTLFSAMNSPRFRSRKFSIKVSFIEIYNEELIDLLADYSSRADDGCRPQVTIREDSKGNILWSGLQEIRVNGVDELMSLLARGSLNRQVGATDMNEQSSRSHAIFSVTMSQQKFGGSPNSTPNSPISPSFSGSGPDSRPSTPSRIIRSASVRTSRKFEEGEGVSITSKFHFVDLAGSERLKRTSAIGERVKEGISINAGLLALGNVISALGDPTKAKHTTHIPYRDSKLTRLLQDSLGGNAQTLMIACVSPAESNLNETVNTLKYANRARNIKNTVTVNSEEIGWNDLEHLQMLVLKLRSEIRALRNNGINETGNGASPTASNSGSGRSTPVYMYGGPGYSPQKRFSNSSLNVVTNANGDTTTYTANSPASASQNQADKAVEILEEQLLELRRSYSELSQKYAKTTAELAIHQENTDGASGIKPRDSYSPSKSFHPRNPSDESVRSQCSSTQLESITEEEEHAKGQNFLLLSEEFQKAVEPVIEEYEKSISNLESQLALNRAAIYHTETLMQEQELKLEYAEKINEQNVSLINDLRNKISEYCDKDSVSEAYIRELEMRLEKYVEEQERDREMIKELRAKIMQMKASEENNKEYIQDIENRLEVSEQKAERFGKVIQRLEERLVQRESEFAELETRVRLSVEEERRLSDEVLSRDARIMDLERKVDEFVSELESLRIIQEQASATEDEELLRESLLASLPGSSPDDSISLRSMVPNSSTISKQENLSVITLESKLLNLQENHVKTVSELSEIKMKYEECLREIHELQTQLIEARLYNSELFDDNTSSAPTTPLTPMSPTVPQYKPRLHSNANITSLRMSFPLVPKSSENTGSQPTSSKNLAMTSLKRLSHRRTKSLTPEIRDKEKRDSVHMAIVQTLQKELKQLELINEEKSQGLDEIKKEFARLECNHRETLEIVEELREEIKRRDALAQMEIMSVITADYTDRGFSVTASELDEHEIILRLREELEHLREEQRRISEIIEQKLGGNKKSDVIEKVDAELRDIIEQLKNVEASSERLDGDEEKLGELQVKKRELERKLEKVNEEHQTEEYESVPSNEKSDECDDEMQNLRLQAEKLQAEIETKSHTLATLLLPSVEHQDTIRRLEDELQEARQAYRLAIEEKINKLTSSLEVDSTKEELPGSLNVSRSPSAASMRVVDSRVEHEGKVKLLEERVKNLELQLLEAREKQKNAIPSGPLVDPAQRTIEVLEENLSALQKELLAKTEIIENLRNESELVAELQTEIESLKSDIKRKEETIETLRRDLVEKGNTQQKIREKEAEAVALKAQLSELKKRDEEMERQVRELRKELEDLETVKNANEELQSELEDVKQQLKIATDKETFALERLKILDADEIKLQQEIRRLSDVEVANNERINELETRLVQQDELGREFSNLQNELVLVKESRNLQEKKIAELESQLEISQREREALENTINEFKLRTLEQRQQIQLAEVQLSSDSNNNIKKIEELTIEIEGLRQQESERCKKIEKLEGQLAEIQQKEISANISIKEELSTLENAKLELVKNVEELEKKLSEAEKEFENSEIIREELKSLRELESEQKRTIDQLKTHLEETIREKELVLEEVEILRKDFGSQKGLVTTLEGELNLVKEELNKSREENQESEKKIEDLSKVMKETLRQREVEECKTKALESQVLELSATNKSRETSMSKLQRELSDAKDHKEAQNELLSKLNGQMVALERERDEQLERERELTNTIETKEIEQREAIESFESIIDNLRNQLKEAKNSSRMDTEAIADLGSKLATVGSQLEEARSLEELRSQVVIELEVKLKETNAAIVEKEELLMSKDALLKELQANAEKAKIQLDNAKISEAMESDRAKKLEVQLYGIQSRLHDLSPSEYEEVKPTKFVMEVELKLVTSDNIEELKSALVEIKAELEKARAAEAEQAEIIKTLELQLQEADRCRDEEISKVKSATVEVERLKVQCRSLQLELDDAHKDSLIAGFQKVDVSIVKDLSKQLKKANREAESQRDRVDELEKIVKQLEFEKEDKEKQNENLQQQIEQLNIKLKLATQEPPEFADTDVISSICSPTNESVSSLALSKLSTANESLRKTNENLNLKILQAQSRMTALTQRIMSLELDLKNLQLIGKDDLAGDSVLQFKNKIANLEAEKEGLTQANAMFSEERKKLDQKIESLLEQITLSGKEGNETAAQFSELNEKIIELEKEISDLKQRTVTESQEMEREIARLLEVNKKLEEEKGQAKEEFIKGSTSEIGPTRAQSLDNSMYSKFLCQESTIIQQNNLIKALQEKIIELELRDEDDSINESSGGMSVTDLDAVGGFRASETTKKKRPGVSAITNLPVTPPSTPPPSLPLPSLPASIGSIGSNSCSRSSTPGCVSPPPRSNSASRPGSRTGFVDLANASAVELSVEIHRLHRKISKMEEENLENQRNVETLETSLSENETNLRVAKQQLQILQREKTDLLDQIKSLRSQLDETTAQFENAKSYVQEEKKVIETVLEEERRAKESAEKARRQLENRMEELMAKKSKFMCF